MSITQNRRSVFCNELAMTRIHENLDFRNCEKPEAVINISFFMGMIKANVYPCIDAIVSEI